MNREEDEEEEEEIICLDDFFLNDDYKLTTFTFGPHVLHFLCLQSASRQLVWPGAMLLNDSLSKNAEILQGCSVIELGSGVGITGMLCSRFFRQVVLTGHNDEVLKILKKNIDLHASSGTPDCCAKLAAEKLEWGDFDRITQIFESYSEGFDLILGADISFSRQASLCFLVLWNTYFAFGMGNANSYLPMSPERKSWIPLIIKEANRHGVKMDEVSGTRSIVGKLEGVIFEVTLQ